MLPDDQPTIPTRPPDPSRSSPPGVWVAPSVEELQAKLPQYEVLEILGRGGMGAVYKARQKSLKRLVAIKILPLGMADDEMKFAERFQNEAQTMAAMNHPAIVSVYDFGETSDGLLYFVMEFVDGTDVQKMIQASGRLSGEYALAITAHVCDALAYAHKRGVIHRDIKPANILIDQEGHIKVADFGLAKMHDPAQTSGLTKTNMAMGTPDYVAPEVLSPGMVADHRADIYAVGVMLYQMLTGEVPRGMFKLPSQKGIGSDPRFDEIICKAMEQDREERYQSAMDVRRALDVILTTPQPKDDGTGVVAAMDIPQKPVAKQPRLPGERSQPPAQKPAQKAAAAPKAKAPPKKPSPTTMWLSIGGIVAVLVVGGWMAFVGMGKTDAAKADMQPVDAAFLAEVAAASPEEQVKLVATRIEALNKVPVLLKPEITSGRVSKVTIARRGSDLPVSDLSPVTALPGLKDITILTPGLRDIAWLRGTTLSSFSVHAKNEITDLTVLRELSLTHLALQASPPRDYSALSGLPLRGLSLSGSPLRDLSFVKGMPLDTLTITNTGVTDFSPLIGLPLRDLTADLVPERDAEILRTIPTLAKINGKPAAEFLASIGTKAKPVVATAARNVDLLPLVDVKRDALAGEWSCEGGELLVKPGKPGPDGMPKLQLPYQPSEEYDFEIEFTPENGENCVYQLLSAYQRSFAWLMDVKLTVGNKAGFDRIDGQYMSGRTNGTVMKPKFLTNGQRHRSTVEVRKTGVRALLDGKELVSYGNSPRYYQAFDSSPNETLRDTLHLGLAARERAVRFHKITVREISGVGKVDANVAGGQPVNSKLTASFFSSVAKTNGPRQVELVGEKIKELNGVPVILVPTIEKGKVLKLVVNRAVETKVPDLSPIAALVDLTTLTIDTPGAGDLSWLRGTKINTFTASNDSFPDLKPLAEQPLAHLTLKSGPVRDYSVLAGLKLRTFVVYGSPVRDISFLKGMPLSNLGLEKTGFSDWSAVRDLPLSECGGDLDPERDGPILRSIPTLKKINGKPAAEFWAGGGEKQTAPARGDMIDWLKADVWRAPWVREGALVKATANDATNWIGKIADGTIRVRFRMPETTTRNSPPLQIAVRATPIAGTTKDARYLFQFIPQKRICHLLYLEKGGGAGTEKTEYLWREKPFLPTSASSNEFEFEIHVDRDQLSIGSGGQVIASARDARVSSGSCGIIANPGIELMRAETIGIEGKKPAAATLPNITSWQDVTNLLRESVRAKAGFTVDSAGVHRASGSPIGDTMVMRAGEKDRAVRVRYVGQTQVSLWIKSGDSSAYVLAARDRVMIKRQLQKDGEAESMVPSVVHPAGFDPMQPHELIVTVRGAVVGVWLDGRHIGEAEDPALKDCAIAIVPMASSTVQKVEVAELDGASATGN